MRTIALSLVWRTASERPVPLLALSLSFHATDAALRLAASEVVHQPAVDVVTARPSSDLAADAEAALDTLSRIVGENRSGPSGGTTGGWYAISSARTVLAEFVARLEAAEAERDQWKTHNTEAYDRALAAEAQVAALTQEQDEPTFTLAEMQQVREAGRAAEAALADTRRALEQIENAPVSVLGDTLESAAAMKEIARRALAAAGGGTQPKSTRTPHHSKHVERGTGQEQRADLQQRLRDTRRALETWGRHKPGCHFLHEPGLGRMGSGQECDCGYSRALAATGGGTTPAPTLSDQNPSSVVGVPWSEKGYAGGGTGQEQQP